MSQHAKVTSVTQSATTISGVTGGSCSKFFYTSIILPEVPGTHMVPWPKLLSDPENTTRQKKLWTQQIAVAAALNSPYLWQETHHHLDPVQSCHGEDCHSSLSSNPRWPSILLHSTNTLKTKWSILSQDTLQKAHYIPSVDAQVELFAKDGLSAKEGSWKIMNSKLSEVPERLAMLTKGALVQKEALVEPDIFLVTTH